MEFQEHLLYIKLEKGQSFLINKLNLKGKNVLDQG